MALKSLDKLLLSDNSAGHMCKAYTDKSRTKRTTRPSSPTLFFEQLSNIQWPCKCSLTLLNVKQRGEDEEKERERAIGEVKRVVGVKGGKLAYITWQTSLLFYSRCSFFLSFSHASGLRVLWINKIESLNGVCVVIGLGWPFSILSLSLCISLTLISCHAMFVLIICDPKSYAHKFNTLSVCHKKKIRQLIPQCPPFSTPPSRQGYCHVCNTKTAFVLRLV